MNILILVISAGLIGLGLGGLKERAECAAVVKERVDVPRYYEEQHAPGGQHEK